ncbi:hypothetical protein TBLA_0I03430 [Henningerozyma blattae CBS 6284]|uniref:J domain-containing protein n=1 Tax=Henningerozyma blattae (strain ATCC 34711 / CBS 6284 / DSM 70876 / NBRC 10599 / NRRL Y-10934 / UCD 77-7) TaxID=1071380 RepID=I2H9E4_HENB6|nr:hypothetical protein TBLA_0I03430 [Tetrapisispora blattae CBS 6284]CCH62996.1 hypothetical protein TBLA_0I03430 [Tetrapisispora blattae CBS 6284]
MISVNHVGIRTGLTLLFIISLVFAFTTEEIEIFRLQKEVAKKYGKDMDFYKFLKLSKMKDSTSKEISKNLRKLSKKYHPDKNKKYRKLYERLNLATQILADDTRRKTYDYYLKNGFPDYDFSKGGFFFRRVQPKTYVLFMFIYLAASVIHYGIMVIQAKGNTRRINEFIESCKEQDDTSGLGEKYLLYKTSADDPGKQVQIRFGDVFIIEADGSRALVTPDSIPAPQVKDCMFFTFPYWMWYITIGRFFDTAKYGKKLGKASKSDEAKVKSNKKGKKKTT